MRYLLKSLIVVSFLMCVLDASAQISGSGYYRFKNNVSNQYIGLSNNIFDHLTMIDNAAGGFTNLSNSDKAKEIALECARRFMSSDIKMKDDPSLIDPSTVVFAKKRYPKNNNNYEYNLMGQSTSLLLLTTGEVEHPNGTGKPKASFHDIYAVIKAASGSGTNTLYTAYITLKADITITILWPTTTPQSFGDRYFVDDEGIFDIQKSSSTDNAKWLIEPLTYFNVAPEVECDGKYYATMYTPFAYTLGEKVENAFAVTSVNSDGSIETSIVATTGETVPAGTPVILECSSNVPSEIKLLLPTGEDAAPLTNTNSNYSGTNLLHGTFFCNTDGNISYTTYNSNGANGSATFNANNYVARTDNMRVLGIGSQSGRLGFFKASNDKMKANKVWLDVSGITFDADASSVEDVTSNAEDFVIVKGNEEPVTVSGKLVTKGEEQYIMTSNKSYKVTDVNQITLGDLSRNGQVEVSDVTYMVNIILGKETDYPLTIADIYQDGVVSTPDITKTVNVILKKEDSTTIVESYVVEEVPYKWYIGQVGGNTETEQEQQ